MQNFIKNLINKNQKKNRQGFTLFELMLAIAIIATLSVVVIVAFSAFRDLAKSNNASRFSGINTIQKALEQYYINNGSYPAGILTGTYLEICDTGQETVENGTTNCAGKVDLRLLVPDYIGAIPRDPN